MYIKIPIYGQETKQMEQQLWYIHTLIQPQVTVHVPPIMQANNLHNSCGYIRDGHRNTKRQTIFLYLLHTKDAILKVPL